MKTLRETYIKGGHCYANWRRDVYREYLYLKRCSDAIVQYVLYQPCFSVAGFLPASHARLYKNMEKENMISMGEMLRCLVGLPYDGGQTLGTRGVDFPAWLGVNLSVYPGERVVCDSSF